MNNISDKTASNSSLYRKIRKNLTKKKMLLLFTVIIAMISFFQPELIKLVLKKIWWLIY